MKNWKINIAYILFPKIQDIVFLVVFLGIVILGPRILNQDGDLGRHITIGNYILANKIIPIQDIFSHTMEGQSLTPHEWLIQVTFAIADHWLGLDGIVLLIAILLSFTFLYLYQFSVQRSDMPIIAMVFTLLGAGASSLHWLARPHVITIFLSIIWLRELENMRQNQNKYWWRLPIIMLLWANSHGAFIVGFVLWLMYFFGDLIDHLLLETFTIKGYLRNHKYWLYSLAASLLVTLINPVGKDLWISTFGFLQNDYLVNHTVEYLSPNFHLPYSWLFLIFIILSIVILARNISKIPFYQVFLIAGWTVMGLYSARNIPIYVVVVTPFLAESFSALIIKHKRTRWFLGFQKNMYAIDKRLFGWILPIIIILLATMSISNDIDIDFGKKGNIFLGEIFPVEAVNWIEKNPQEGNSFNYFPWGGYILYRMWPNQKVFIDGQTDFYGEALTREYEQVITASHGWENILIKYDVSWVLIPNNTLLSDELSNTELWQIIYLDDTSVIYQEK